MRRFLVAGTLVGMLWLIWFYDGTVNLRQQVSAVTSVAIGSFLIACVFFALTRRLRRAPSMAFATVLPLPGILAYAFIGAADWGTRDYWLSVASLLYVGILAVYIFMFWLGWPMALLHTYLLRKMAVLFRIVP